MEAKQKSQVNKLRNNFEKEACMLHHPHTEALIVTFPVENINLHRILINTSSLIDILFSEA